MTVLTLVLALFTAGCDGFTHLQGRVTDMNSKPIQGAEVEMKTISGGRDDKSTTQVDGAFSVGFTHAPFNVDLMLTVSKEGYKTVERRFTSRDAKQFPSTIVMEAIPNATRPK